MNSGAKSIDMKTVSRVIFCALALFVFTDASAQRFLWNARFDSQFDNREYKSEINWPQTLFGARLTPEIGIGWGNGNGMMIGVDLMADFGAKTFNTDPELLFYYQYDSKRFKAYAGVFPRHKLMGGYSNAFFSDSVRFYDANLDGLLLQYVGGRGYVEVACDWNSMLSQTTREKFMLFSSGRVNTPVFYAGYNVSMYHHAGTVDEDGVVDNVLLNPYIGVDLTRKLPLDSLYLQAGWMQAFQNDRKYVGEYVSPHGVQIELRVEKWKFGVFNTAYIGKNLMPYYDAPYFDYGHGLYFGEPFYRTNSNIYDRLELYWHPIRKESMNLRVASIHHYDGKKWGWQQMVTFWVNINEKMFRKR